MLKYKVINLPLNDVKLCADRLNETSSEGWSVVQMFQAGQNGVCILSIEVPNGTLPPAKKTKKTEEYDILSGVK